MKEPISPYVEDRYAEKNEFISMQPDMSELPDFEKEKGKLPEPVWAGHDDEIAAYYKAWEIAFRNLGKPTKESGFVSPYIDAAFNGHIFMWDSCFMLMFGKYGDSVHCFQKTLDNFYCKQHKDGFICREINELDGVDRFYRHDPTSTGDLGEKHKVAVLSVTEGEDKPLKYPHMFAAASLMLLNKVDLLPYLNFDVEKCIACAREVNPEIEIILISATSGEGMEQWLNWLETQRCA